MSILKVTDIQSNGTGFNDVVSFKNASGTENGTLCRAWVNFDGTFGTSPFTIANGGIRAAFNVSSVTEGGDGVYTVNFTNAMPDTNYVCNISLSRTPVGGFAFVATDTGSSQTTTSSYFTVYGNYPSGSTVFQDVARIYASYFR